MAVMTRSCFLSLCISFTLFLTSSCNDEDEPEIKYPETGFYGDNILMKGKTEYTALDNSLRAWVPDGKN